jgi:trk system potassium uptake protein
MFIVRLQTHPTQLIAVSFLLTILIGTLLLTFPGATADGVGADVLTAFFTATSATCVTGLIVVDTPTHFSRFGQTVILLLIQIGGLGIMTLSASMSFILGRGLGATEKRVMENLLDESLNREIRRAVLYIVQMTFIVELIGGLLLFLRWRNTFDTGTAIYMAVFHAVSAFCNAGFALFSDSLISYSGDIPVNLIVTTLIILGGIGFTAVFSVVNRETFRKGPRRVLSLLPVHTRLVGAVTVALILFGTLCLFFLEYDGSLLDLSVREKLLASYFQSVTLRTAGFNTIDIGGLKPATIFIMSMLMFIGASPGSTGGGIKTTTFGILALSVRAMLMGRNEVEAYGRTIPQNTVLKAIAIAFISLAILGGFLAMLLSVETIPFLPLMFEAVSAFGTVGLSTGITPNLTPMSKVLSCVLMFIGRLGPLTLAIAVGEKNIKGLYRYPDGKVMVG